MHTSPDIRAARERIIAAEVLKLEHRRAKERELAHRRDEERREDVAAHQRPT
jgi:hypothetical protein